MGQKRKGAPPSGAGKGGKKAHNQHHSNKKHKKAPSSTLRDIALPDEHQDASDEDMVSDEDLDFVQNNAQKLGFLVKLDRKALDKAVHEKQKAQAAAAAAPKAAAGDGEGGEDEDDDEGDEEGVEEYEKAPRTTAKEKDKDKGSASLPVKTLTGELVFQPKVGKGGDAKALIKAPTGAIQVAGVTIEDDMVAHQKAAEERKAKEAEEKAAAEAAAEAAQRKREAAERAREREAALPPALRSLKAIQDREQRQRAAREAMATAATKLLSGPEDHVGEIKTLLGLAGDADMQVSRLALLSLLAVFRDILPGYRIRPPTEKEMETKVTKDVQKRRDFEAALLRHYQAYLKALLAAAGAPAVGGNGAKGKGKNGGGGGGGGGGGNQAVSASALAHSRVAVKCMSQLLVALPHFNYTSDLLQAVVPRLASPDQETRELAVSAVRSLLQRSDVLGQVAVECVQLVADLVKRRQCVCPPEVVRCLSVLRFTQVVVRKEDEEDGKKGGKKSKDKDKEDKGAKKRQRTHIDDEVERDFKEAEAGPDARQLARQQSKMLEALFEIYFRVLKHCTASPQLMTEGGAASKPAGAAGGAVAAGQQPQAQAQQQGQQQAGGKKRGKGAGGAAAGAAASIDAWLAGAAVAPGLGLPRDKLLKRFPLLYPSLEGLARYTHLISVEYFNDIMEVFHQLLRAPGLPLVERLRVILTASEILRGQGEALNIDRRDFYTRLYESLLSVPIRGLLETGADGREPEGETEADDGPTTAAAAAAAAAALGGIISTTGAPAGGGVSSSEPASVLMASALSQLLCEPKIIDMARLAAFVKRAASMALEAGADEAMVLMGAILRLVRRYPKLGCMLEYEGEAPLAGKAHDPECPDPTAAGALSATLWELSVLAHSHYHPHVAQAASSLLALAPGNSLGLSTAAQKLSGPLALPGTLRDLALAYSSARGSFRPAPPQTKPGGRGSGVLQVGSSTQRRLLQEPATEECAELLNEAHATLATGSASASSDAGAGKQGAQQAQAGSSGVDGEDDAAQQDEDEEGAVEAALRKQFRMARRFEVNAELRREKELLVSQVKRMMLHLHERKQEQQQMQKQKQQQQQQRPQGAVRASSGGKTKK